MDHRIAITTAAEKVCEALASADYLESNFRVTLARELRKTFDVYEEVVVPYTLDVIPIGQGYVDIAVMTSGGAILLELKTTKKKSYRQLCKYIKHWKYCPVKCGATIHFVNDTVTTTFY